MRLSLQAWVCAALVASCATSATDSGSGGSGGSSEQPACGDGAVDEGELCDDGNQLAGDGCSADCLSDESCGNNIVDEAVGEACDDGNSDDDDGCTSACGLPTCGNGALDDGEVCDDGNNDDGDGCSASCVSDETCSNGITDVAAGEQCDDGNIDDGDGCSSSCALEYCGNSIIDVGEVCDDGDTVDGDGCSADCLSNETCGNTIVDAAVGEHCDGTNDTACPNACVDCTCAPGGPCATLGSVGDPSCRIVTIEQTNIGSCGFFKPWRGQDISFVNGALITGVEFRSGSSGALYDELRVMTDVTNLITLDTATAITHYQDGANWWDQVTFTTPITLSAATEYTIWFHLLNASGCTSGADLTLVNANWGGHHTDGDPSDQTAGSPPEWNYQYGTNMRLYGIAY